TMGCVRPLPERVCGRDFCYRICIRGWLCRREAGFKWSASDALIMRCEVHEPEPHADAGCFEGNYQSYKEDLKRRKGVDADQPHRVAYRKLVRA
ncbi:MAG: hypothetical protein M3310_00620, partial [Actinomycetota bacterium]|nr:hypothetical protein [Actinomycetota bacterium]